MVEAVMIGAVIRAAVTSAAAGEPARVTDRKERQ
jgi:hypothetical protein